jgi:hypothetical protein
MHFLQAINSDISVLIVCNKTGGTIKGDTRKNILYTPKVNNHTHSNPPLAPLLCQINPSHILLTSLFEVFKKIFSLYD